MGIVIIVPVLVVEPVPVVPVVEPVPVDAPVVPDGESPLGALASPVSAEAIAGAAAATESPRNAATANSLARFLVFAERLRCVATRVPSGRPP